MSGLPIERIDHYMTEEELTAEFGKNGWKQLPDAISRRYRFVPAKVEVEEHHIGVYSDKKDGHMVKAKHPRGLLHGSTVSPTLAATIMNGKYVNAIPLYRLEQEFRRYGLAITGKTSSGKSDLANALCICALRQFKTTRYIKASQLINELSKAEKLDNYQEELSIYAGYDLLVVDDFGLMSLDVNKCRNLFEVFDSSICGLATMTRVSSPSQPLLLAGKKSKKCANMRLQT
mgnify:CR=1 FL=1